MRALMWLAEYGKDASSDAEHADGAIDYERVIQLMQNVSKNYSHTVMHTYLIHTSCVTDTPRKRIRRDNGVFS